MKPGSRRGLDAFGRWVFESRRVRLGAYHALSAWQYLAGSNAPMYGIGIRAWKRLASSLPVRRHLLLCGAGAESPLSLPEDTRAFVTSAREAKLQHFDDVVREAEKLASSADIDATFEAMTRGGDRYHYRLHLNPRDVTDPRNAVFAKFALQPKIAGLVRNYFGIPCRLNEIRILLDRPTPDPPSGAQNWHRDPDDWMTVSVITYLCDVGAETAPFCYLPFRESRRLYGKVGKFREFSSWRVANDAAMEKMCPREHWVEVTGPKGTMIFLDSASCYHRGKKAVSGRRLCLQLVFTSTFSRMDLLEKWDRLRRPDFERRHAFESPAYSIPSSSHVLPVREASAVTHDA